VCGSVKVCVYGSVVVCVKVCGGSDKVAAKIVWQNIRRQREEPGRRQREGICSKEPRERSEVRVAIGRRLVANNAAKAREQV